MEIFLTDKIRLSLRWFMRTLMIFLSFIYPFHRKQIVLQESAINLAFVWTLVSIRLRVDGRSDRHANRERITYTMQWSPPRPQPLVRAGGTLKSWYLHFSRY